MGALTQMALAPAAVLLIYVYIRDKYEKEPIRLLLLGVIYGAVSTGIILALGTVVQTEYFSKGFFRRTVLYFFCLFRRR